MIRSVVIVGDGTAGRMIASYCDAGFGDRPGGGGRGRARLTTPVWRGRRNPWPSAPPPVGSAG